MKSSLSVLLVGLTTSCSIAQETECNRNAWTNSIKRKLPIDICLDKGKVAYQILSDFDYNKDQLSDIAIKLGREKMSNGDTTLLVVYTRRQDSSFVKFRTLENVYPIHFENYSLDYQIKDSRLAKLKDRYQNFNPLEKLEITESNIVIRILADITTSFLLNYEYDSDRENWFLIKMEMYDRENKEVTSYGTYQIGSSIEEFNYFDYLEGKF